MFDEFVVAHTLGWWAKALFLRNNVMLWTVRCGRLWGGGLGGSCQVDWLIGECLCCRVPVCGLNLKQRRGSGVPPSPDARALKLLLLLLRELGAWLGWPRWAWAFYNTLQHQVPLRSPPALLCPSCPAPQHPV